MESSKLPRSQDELPAPIDFSHFVSRLEKNRKPSAIKAFYKYFTIPGVGNLAGGLPNANYFPYDTLEASVALPNRFKPTPNDPVDPPTAVLQHVTLSDDPKAARVLVPHYSAETNILRKIDVATALQYGLAQGYPALFYFLRQFARENLHPNVPYKGGAEIILDCGSTDGFSKCVTVLSNVWDEQRDWIREKEGLLCEEFAYMSAVQTARPRGLNIVPVVVDDEGMTASGKGGLADVLENWDFNRGKRPHLMYTVTMGQNPTSGLLSVTRRKEIYALCHKYDILIIEDDPYWYLQYPSANKLSLRSRGKPVSANHPLNSDHNYNTADGGKSSGYPFLDSLVPSYLSIDTDGRVLRLDTFSKTVAPGCRLGWITAQPALIDYIYRATETSTAQPSGFVQSLIAEMIMGPHNPRDGIGGGKDGFGWKMDGWIRWLEGLRGNYERRMQLMARLLDEGKYYVEESKGVTMNTQPCKAEEQRKEEEEEGFQLVSKTQMYDFVYPLAGMFLWVHMRFETHPLFNKVVSPRLARAMFIFLTMPPYLCLVTPGDIFAPTPEIAAEKGWQYLRLCFAAVDDDVLEMHTKHMVDGVTAFWGIKTVKEIDDIMKEEDQEDQETREETSKVLSTFSNNLQFC